MTPPRDISSSWRQMAASADDLDGPLPMPPRRFRAIFVSDWHLGTPGCQAAALLQFLRCPSTGHHLCLDALVPRAGERVDGGHT